MLLVLVFMIDFPKGHGRKVDTISLATRKEDESDKIYKF